MKSTSAELAGYPTLPPFAHFCGLVSHGDKWWRCGHTWQAGVLWDPLQWHSNASWSHSFTCWCVIVCCLQLRDKYNENLERAGRNLSIESGTVWTSVAFSCLTSFLDKLSMWCQRLYSCKCWPWHKAGASLCIATSFESYFAFTYFKYLAFWAIWRGQTLTVLCHMHTLDGHIGFILKSFIG